MGKTRVNLPPRRTTRTALAAASLVTLGAATASGVAPPPPTLTVGSNPIDVVSTADNSHVYVVNDGSVSVIDTATQVVTSTFQTGFQDQTTIGLASNDSRLVVGTFDRTGLKIVDPVAEVVLDRVRLAGRGATSVTTLPSRSGRAYVSLLTAQQVALVNTNTGTLVRKVDLPRGPQTVEATPDSSEIWVGSSYSGRIWAINPAAQKVNRIIKVDDAGPVVEIAFTPNGKRAWVAGLGGVQVVKVSNGKELAFIPATRFFPKAESLNLGGLALTPDGSSALVLNSTFPDSPGQGKVAVLDTASLQVTQRIPLGTEPTSIATAGSTTYVTNYMDDTVSYFPTPTSP